MRKLSNRFLRSVFIESIIVAPIALAIGVVLTIAAVQHARNGGPASSNGVIPYGILALVCYFAALVSGLGIYIALSGKSKSNYPDDDAP